MEIRRSERIICQLDDSEPSCYELLETYREEQGLHPELLIDNISPCDNWTVQYSLLSIC